MHGLGQFLLSYGVGGALSAVVGILVGIGYRRIMRLIRAGQAELKTGQAVIQDKVQKAVDQSAHAIKRTDTLAAAQTTTSTQVNEAIVFLADNVGHALDEISMAGRIDKLLTANVRLRTIIRENGLDIPLETGYIKTIPESQPGDEESVVTGRHRLATQMIATITPGGDE